jgi:uncharacterized membrane protein YfhO
MIYFENGQTVFGNEVVRLNDRFGVYNMIFVRAIKRVYVYLLAFLLPAGIMLAVYIALHISPFGPKTLLTIDMTNEYVDYFSAFKSMFTGGSSIFYSFSKLLGGNMTGLFAYYLASPLNVVFLFFGRASFDKAVMLVTLLKVGFCGLTFAIFLDRTFKRRSLLTAVFSVFYALMAYNIVYQLNIMWLDGVIFLPLVMLGVDRIIGLKKPLVFYIFLTLAILTNFYIGFMICLFSVLYFVYRLLLSDSYRAAFLKARFFRSRLFTFIFTAVLSAGTSCVLILPAMLSLQTSKEHFYLASMSFYQNYKFFGIFSKLALGSYSYNDVMNGLPNIFCGVFVTLLIGLYFFNRLIPFKEKILSLLFVVIMLFNFNINTFNKIWHGLNPPAWYPFRYSFVFSFLLIVLAYRAVINLRGVRLRHIVLTFIAMLVVLIILAGSGFEDLSAKKIAMTAVFAAVYCAILIYSARVRHLSGGMLALLLIPYVICEFGYNSYELLSSYSLASESYYSSYVQQTSAAVDAVQAQDTGFYRMDKTYTRLDYNAKGDPTFNDPMMFGYNGVSNYSSADDKYLNSLMQSLGYTNFYTWAYFDRGSTTVANSLLDVKYILSESPLDSSYQQMYYQNGVYVYKNPYALPVAFMADRSVKKLQQITNPFILQNKILSSMLGDRKAECFYTEKGLSLDLDNLRTVKNGPMSRFIRVNPARPASLRFTFTAGITGPVYANFNTDNPQPVSLALNGQPFGKYFDTYDGGVLPLGSYQKGDEVTFTLALRGNETDIADSEFYSLDMGTFGQDYARLSAGGLQVSSYDSTHIRGDINSTGNGDVLYTSIPYDPGWKVTVDGKPVRDFKIMGTLMGVYVPPGRHTVDFSFLPQGFTAGIVLSALSAVIASLYFLALHSRRSP